jgi:hypothetical protein
MAAVAAIAAIVGWREYRRMLRDDPQSIPWTPLDLNDPVGRFSAMKLARLTGDARQCRALLAGAASNAAAVGAVTGPDGQCGYIDGVRLAPAEMRYVPGGLATSCPVAAALTIWEREVQRLARDRLGTTVVAVDHFGSYSCRRRNGASSGEWSEHATADAIDIAGFRLADGRRLTIVNHWDGGNAAERAFLRGARDLACDLFTITLSPDYNAAHRDHLHFDMAESGATGFGMCR